MKKLLKNMLLAIIPALVLACTVQAEDNDLLNELAAGGEVGIAVADIQVEELDFGDLDIDQLADAAEPEEDDAIEACFRRVGYSSYGHGYSYGHRYPSYGHCYPSYSYCRPLYSYHSYRTYYTPICAPVYSYWGCY